MHHLLEKIWDSANHKKYHRECRRLIEKINDFSGSLAGLSDAELAFKTVAFRQQLANGQKMDEILPEAFAVVSEAAERVLGLRPFPVQLMGGIALHRGMFAEMKTGEGKTLTATLPAYLNALTDDGVHIVTINEYLAQRDSRQAGRIFHLLGLTVGCLPLP